MHMQYARWTTVYIGTSTKVRSETDQTDRPIVTMRERERERNVAPWGEGERLLVLPLPVI